MSIFNGSKQKVTLKKDVIPVYKQRYFSSEFVMPKLIHVVDVDERKVDKNYAPVIGFLERVKGQDIFTIESYNAQEVGLRLCPSGEPALFFENAFKNNTFINVDDYFEYFQTERINELTRIAQTLGAEKISITIKAKMNNGRTIKLDAPIRVGLGRLVSDNDSDESDIEEVPNTRLKKDKSKRQIVNVLKGTGVSKDDEQYVTVDEFKDRNFNGHNNPVFPELVYFKNDSTINELIRSRMDGTNKLRDETYRIVMDKSLGINLKVAANIDLVIKGLGLSANVSFVKNVKQQKRMIFEYYIKFPDS